MLGADATADHAALLAGTLQAPISLDEMSNLVSVNNTVWTGSQAGMLAQHCSDWSATNVVGTIGDAGAVDASWEGGNTSTCLATWHLYCFEVP